MIASVPRKSTQIKDKADSTFNLSSDLLTAHQTVSCPSITARQASEATLFSMAPPSIRDRKPTKYVSSCSDPRDQAILICYSEHFDEIIEVEVGSGSGKRNYSTYKGLLSFYSEYFEEKVNGKFKEAADKKLILDGKDPDIFAIFYGWLYTGELRQDGKVGTDLSSTTLVKLWIFGDEHLCPLLQNEAMDAFLAAILKQWKLPIPNIRQVYENTTADAKLRKALIETIAQTTPNAETCSGRFADDNMPYWTTEALVDFATFMSDRPRYLSKTAFAALDCCLYHVHEEGITCKRKIGDGIAAVATNEEPPTKK